MVIGFQASLWLLPALRIPRTESLAQPLQWPVRDFLLIKTQTPPGRVLAQWLLSWDTASSPSQGQEAVSPSSALQTMEFQTPRKTAQSGVSGSSEKEQVAWEI